MRSTCTTVELRFEKHFTLEEATALIPAIRRVFAHVHALVGTNQASLKPTNGAPHSGNGKSVGGNGNGKAPKDAPTESDYTQLSREERTHAAAALLDTLGRQGIIVQDFKRGLIDFPSIRDGHEILLCYELADGDQIQFFHELDAGFAGRQPL